MTINSQLCTCALLTVVLLGCGGSESGLPIPPTSPSVSVPAPTPTPPAPPVQGGISLTTVTHPSGSTLAMDDCGPSWTGIPGHHVCTEEWRGTFEVTVNRDVADAVITVTFEGPQGRCGIVYLTGLAFFGGREQFVSTSAPLFMTYEPEGYDNMSVVRYCDVPTTTERLVVQLWDRGGGVGSAANPLLRKEFDYAYTFVSK